VGLNLNRGMDVCPRLFRVCVLLCRKYAEVIRQDVSHVQGVLPAACKIRGFGLNLNENSPEGLVRKSRGRRRTSRRGVQDCPLTFKYSDEADPIAFVA
jgi:hypothetical protein